MSDLIRREDVARAVRLLSEAFIDGGSPTAAMVLNIAMDRINALPAVQPAHVNEPPKSEHEAANMLTLTAERDRLREALIELIQQTHNCERELTEDLHHVDFCGESVPLTNAREALKGGTP